MMIGVAQVIGTKPIANSFFSSGPVLSTASALAAPRGNTLDSEDSTAPAPRLRKSSRRVVPTGNTLRSTAASTRFSIADSAATDGAPSNDASCSFKRPPNQDARTIDELLQERDQAGLSSSAGITEERSAPELCDPTPREAALDALVGFLQNF